MARVTVEDCLEYCENRFDLVLKAADRAHCLELGRAEAKVDWDNDKPTVVALREIAAGYDVTRDEAEERRRQEESALVERFLGAAAPAANYQDDVDAQLAGFYIDSSADAMPDVDQAFGVLGSDVLAAKGEDLVDGTDIPGEDVNTKPEAGDGAADATDKDS